MDNKIHDEPSKVEVQEGGVHVDGPDAVDVTMTPKAALETAKRLGNAAVDLLIDNPDGPPGKTDKA
jgi:hypothetical protein